MFPQSYKMGTLYFLQLTAVSDLYHIQMKDHLPFLIGMVFYL